MRTGLLASTVTPGRTAPVVSLTLPAMELWARAAAGSNTTEANAMKSEVATTFVRILGLRETNDDRLILREREAPWASRLLQSPLPGLRYPTFWLALALGVFDPGEVFARLLEVRIVLNARSNSMRASSSFP